MSSGSTHTTAWIRTVSGIASCYAVQHLVKAGAGPWVCDGVRRRKWEHTEKWTKKDCYVPPTDKENRGTRLLRTIDGQGKENRTRDYYVPLADMPNETKTDKPPTDNENMAKDCSAPPTDKENRATNYCATHNVTNHTESCKLPMSTNRIPIYRCQVKVCNIFRSNQVQSSAIIQVCNVQAPDRSSQNVKEEHIRAWDPEWMGVYEHFVLIHVKAICGQTISPGLRVNCRSTLDCHDFLRSYLSCMSVLDNCTMADVCISIYSHARKVMRDKWGVCPRHTHGAREWSSPSPSIGAEGFFEYQTTHCQMLQESKRVNPV